MGSNEIVTKQCSAVLKAAHSAANGTEKDLNFKLLRSKMSNCQYVARGAGQG